MTRVMAREGGVEAFGEQLRREREQRGVALEAICDATKVPARHIRALEAGAFADLPGGVFRRGFLRSYLNALGLEEVSWMRRFEQSCRESGLPEPPETGWVAFAENVKNNRAATRRRTGLRKLRLKADISRGHATRPYAKRRRAVRRCLPSPASGPYAAA